MPFLVKTSIEDSPINGKGLFAGEFIPKGTIIWEFSGKPKIPCKNIPTVPNKSYSETELKALPKEQIHQILRGGAYHYGSDKMCAFLDGNHYCNYSSDPNVILIMPEGKSQEHIYMPAIKDIQEGEEMVGDYDCIKYPKGIWIDKLYEELDPERYQLTEKKSQ